MKLTDVKNRKVFEGIEITNEVIRPVSEKWVDGLVHETDNLQLTIKSINEKPITDVMAYLYYYDANGKELGHDFDITDSKIKQDKEARLSFMLSPPDYFKYAELEIKAEYEERYNFKANIIFFVVCAAAIYGYQFFKSA
jgi:hypothetical protein